MEIQPHEELFQKHGTVAMSGVVEAKPDKAFHIMVANYGKDSCRLSKKQNLGTIVPQEKGITPNKIVVTEVFGLEKERPKEST